MNYQRLYDILCKRGQERMLEGYTEKHHIVPRCLGGTDCKSNITKLTAKEHYIVHHLLTRIYPRNYKLLHAFAAMARVSPGQNRTYHAKQYERMTIARSEAMRLNNPAASGAWNSGTKGHGRQLRKSDITPEERAAISERMKKNNPNADGKRHRKEVETECVDSGRIINFVSLTDAEQQMREITGKVINHSSVSSHMKKGTPYKGYLWRFKVDKLSV